MLGTVKDVGFLQWYNVFMTRGFNVTFEGLPKDKESLYTIYTGNKRHSYRDFSSVDKCIVSIN